MALIPPIHKPCQLKAKLSDKRQLTHNVWEYDFELLDGSECKFEPGQFVNINIPHPEKRVVRSYSIASSPKNAHGFTLCIKLMEGGLGSNYFKSLEIGDEVTGMGAFGIFTVKDDYKENLLMVATGTGVAPMKSMLEYQFEREATNKMILFFGVRHEKDVFYDEVLTQMDIEHKNFDYYLTLSRPEGNWEGLDGRVTALIEEFEADGKFKPGGDLDVKNLRVLLCGSGAMIEEVSKIFKKMGLSAEKIHHEKFF